MKKKTTYVINVGKNNYYNKPKENCIETPNTLSRFIFNLYTESNGIAKNIWDIGCGKGSLSFPFNKRVSSCIGVDINIWYKDFYPGKFIPCDFIAQSEELLNKFATKNPPDIILCNPPFNYKEGVVPEEVKLYWRGNGFKERPLYPHVFLHKIFKVFGENAKVILFVPMGFLRNQRVLKSGRYSERYTWLLNTKARITGILTVPMNIFDKVIVHSDILFWNIPRIKPHYIYKNNINEDINEKTM